MLYEIKAVLHTDQKPVWRMLTIDPDMTFLQLHHLLQVVMNWEDDHEHVFRAQMLPQGRKPWKRGNVGEERYEIGSSYEGGWHDCLYKETIEKVGHWLTPDNPSLTYHYDFGEDWQIDITLERLLADGPFPYCSEVMNEAPPEDSRFAWEAGEIEETRSNDEMQRSMNLVLKDSWMQFTGQKTPPLSYIQDNVWSKLLRTADLFKKEKYWEQIAGDSCFAIEEPMFGEMLYCTVLGGNDEVYGLAVYVGHEGLDGLLHTLSGEMDPFGQRILSQRSLLLSFEDRSDLTKEDYNLIKRHGFSFRGKKQWPQMESYEPGFYPAPLVVKQAYQLLWALEMTLQVCRQAVENPAMLQPKQGWLLVKQDGSFTTMRPNHHTAATVPLYIPQFVLKQTKKAYKQKHSLIFDVFYLMQPVQEHPFDRPYYPSALVAVEGDSGMIVHHDVLPPDDLDGDAQQALISCIEHLGWIPRVIYVEQERVKRFIMPVARELNIDVQIVAEIELLWELRNGMMMM